MENFKEILFQPFGDFWVWFAAFMPNLIAMFIIVIAGLLFAWVFRFLLLRFFRAVNFDVWSDRIGLTAIIRKGDIWTKPAEFFVHIIYLFIIIMVLMIGLNALHIQIIDNLIAQFFLYFPRALSAILILITGYVIAGFLSRAALIAAVNSGYHYAKLLAEAVRLLLIVLTLAMALEQLRIAPGIIIAAFSIIFGGIVIALSIAFGVGGINAAKKIIEKGSEEKKEEGKEIEHI